MNSMIRLFKERNSDKQSVHRYGFLYDLLISHLWCHKREGLNILEIGVSEFGDGSFSAWGASELISRVVGIDIEDYEARLTEKMTFYKLDAYNKASLRYIAEVEKTPFDLIIDDGSGEEKDQAFFLENYTALLSENGFLVCEDIYALYLINDQYLDERVFCIDGWANRGIEVSSFNMDPHFSGHNERILIKSKTQPIKPAKVHENKPHIPALPDFSVPEYPRTSNELAISIPLFHSELDNWDEKRFQDVHCKGAIWAGISLLMNSDLAENGVPLYFHIEDKVWDAASPVFQRFGVPDSWCRRMEAPWETPEMNINKPAFGKSYMGLLDSEIDPDILMIADSDLFTCVTDTPMSLYKKLTSPLLQRHPSMMYFKLRSLPYAWYVSILMLASGMSDKLIESRPLQELEVESYKRLGFEKEASDLEMEDTIEGFFSEDYFMTFPRGHKTRDYAISRMNACYATPYIFAAWAEFNYSFLDLSDILGVPVYDWESQFIDGIEGDDCFAHFRVDKCSHDSMTQPSRINEYWERFLQNVSRHVGESV